MDESEAKRLVAELLGVEPLYAEYMAFGHNSITYDVALPGRNVIVRMNQNAQVFARTEQNLGTLEKLGLPVPHVLAVDLSQSKVPFAYMVLEKIPGRDLRYELATMTPGQMTRLAEQLVTFQRTVGTLPPGAGYGYVAIGEKGPHVSWRDAVQAELDLQHRQNDGEQVGLLAERVQQQLHRGEAYFREVPPTCFLDDITVKNVIVQHGTLQGLIDFDCVCYGDPLFWLALTATGVVCDVGTAELFYVEELKRFWGLTEQQDRVLGLYSAGMVVSFIRRFGASETQAWNQRMREMAQLWLK